MRLRARVFLAGVFSVWFALAPVLHAADSPGGLPPEDVQYLEQLARDTYRCIDFYVEPVTGMPYDNTRFTADAQTSVTNIGFYIASVAAGVELGFEKRKDAVKKLRKLFASLKKLPKWNNYPHSWNHCTKLVQHQEKFVSTVDLGNYYAGIIVARQYFPELAAECDAELAIDWNKLYDPNAQLLHGGFDTGKNSYGAWHYNYLGADSRLASFLAIGMSDVPAASWDALDRTLEERYGIEYLKPGWQGGGLFLGFMSGLFLDERGTLSGFSAGNFARAQIVHKDKIGSPVWGWSASDSPTYGYLGWQAIRDDIVTPHATALALPVFPREAVANLRKLDELGARPRHLVNGRYMDFGFRDSYDTKTGLVTQSYLILDQTMLFLSLANFLKDNAVVRLFESYPAVKKGIEVVADYRNRSSSPVVYPVELKDRFKLRSVPFEVKQPIVKVPSAKVPPEKDSKQWAQFETVVLATGSLEYGNIRDEKDLSAACSFLWDAQFLYVKVNVTDQSVVARFAGADIHKEDILELYINPDSNNLLWGNPKDFQLGFEPPDAKGSVDTYAWFQNKAPSLAEVFAKGKRTADGYEITAAVSWKFLGVNAPVKDTRIGLSVAVHDVDSDAFGDSKLNWYFRPDSGKIELPRLVLQ